jgi:hypothetical protein
LNKSVVVCDLLNDSVEFPLFLLAGHGGEGEKKRSSAGFGSGGGSGGFVLWCLRAAPSGH